MMNEWRRSENLPNPATQKLSFFLLLPVFTVRTPPVYPEAAVTVGEGKVELRGKFGRSE